MPTPLASRVAFVLLTGLALVSVPAGAQSPISQVQKLIASGGDDDDFAGHAVAISGNTAVVGAPGFTDDETDQGAAYVWERDPGTNLWSPVKQLLASDPGFDNFFGAAVAIDGDRIVVSAPDNDIGFEVDAGAVYVFERDAGGAGNWGQVAQLFGSLAGGAVHFGTDVDVSGNTIVAGEPETDGVGNVFVFERVGGVWVETQVLSPPDDFLRFGADVDLDGDQLLVAAPERTLAEGRAYVHGRNQGGAGNWGLVATLSVDDALGVEFADRVAIHGDTAVVGDTDAGGATGRVFIFQRDQGGPNAWGFLKSIEPAGNPEEAGFGFQVAIRGDRILAMGNSPATATTFGRNQGGANNWGELQTLVLDGTTNLGTATTSVGFRLALTGGGLLGETAIIGESRGDTGNPNQGFAYIFGNTTPQPILETVSGAIGGSGSVLLAKVSDGEQEPQTIAARIDGGESSTRNGVTVSNLAIDALGDVTADVEVACGASEASFELSFGDEGGLIATETLTIATTASAPPVITLAGPVSLGSPNHKYRSLAVGSLASASDDCDGDLSASLVVGRITSDEADNAPGGADGNTVNDAVVVDCRNLRLRAERDETKNGRVYGITLRVSDTEGSASEAVFRVAAPVFSDVPALEDAPVTEVNGCP